MLDSSFRVLTSKRARQNALSFTDRQDDSESDNDTSDNEEDAPIEQGDIDPDDVV